MANAFVHVELNTTDVDQAKDFYGNLFQWDMEDLPMGDTDYTMIRVENNTVGGIMKHPMGGPTLWIPYVAVDDILAATAKAKSLGANIIRDVTEVEGAGWLSIFIDPTGGVLGLWKPQM